MNDARLLIEQDDAERAIYINQDGNSQAIYINNNGTASGIYLDNNNSGFAIEIENTGSTVSGLQIYSNQGNSQNSALSNFIADNTDFDQNVMQIQNDGTGYGLKIDQNGNNIALLIDGENTGSFYLKGDQIVDGNITANKFIGDGSQITGISASYVTHSLITASLATGSLLVSGSIHYTSGSTNVLLGIRSTGSIIPGGNNLFDLGAPLHYFNSSFVSISSTILSTLSV